MSKLPFALRLRDGQRLVLAPRHRQYTVNHQVVRSLIFHFCSERANGIVEIMLDYGPVN